MLENSYVMPTYARADIAFVSGDNATLIDSEGRDYIDFTSGIGVVSIGHGDNVLARTLCNQARKIIHISNLYQIEQQEQAAKKIVAASGYDMNCFFGNSGAEANEGAIKIARKYGEVDGEPKRYKIITLKHSFHGRTITTVKATGQEAMHNYFGPFPDGFVYADNIGDIEGLVDDHTVAVMIELIQGEGGVQPIDKAQVQALAAFLKSKNVLLIVDEVQTGVYRTGEFTASQVYDIKPDIITLAKGLGGGVPIGVVMSSKKDVLQAGDHGSTFGGNYLSSTAAMTVVDFLNHYKESGALDEMIIAFSQKLDELQQKYPALFSEAVGFGLMRGLRMNDSDTLAKLINLSRENGVMVLRAGRNTLRFLPPLTITKDEMEEGFVRLEKAITAL